MPRPKLDTVNSIVKSGDALTFEIQIVRDGTPIIQKKKANKVGCTKRWKCGGCDEVCKHEHRLDEPNHLLFREWEKHLHKEHPEFEL